MDTLYVILTMIISYYSYTYARWLKEGGNRRGMLGVYLLILLGVGLTAYRSLQ